MNEDLKNFREIVAKNDELLIQFAKIEENLSSQLNSLVSNLNSINSTNTDIKLTTEGLIEISKEIKQSINTYTETLKDDYKSHINNKKEYEDNLTIKINALETTVITILKKAQEKEELFNKNFDSFKKSIDNDLYKNKKYNDEKLKIMLDKITEYNMTKMIFIGLISLLFGVIFSILSINFFLIKIF